MNDLLQSDAPSDEEKAKEEPAIGELIAAPQGLRTKCLRPGNASLAALDAVARAEAALQELSVNFDDWMKAETDRLAAAHTVLRHNGESPEAVETLFEAAHDLKGQAGTLGYPIAAEICASLCRLLEAVADQQSRLSMPLVDHHVDAVKAIVRENASGAEHDTANALSERLRTVTDDYLRREAGAAG